MVQVVWFKRDLRTIDHRPLAEAAAAGPLIPLYVVEPDYWTLPDTSRRQWCAIRDALEELADRLAALGAPLIIRRGPVTDCLSRIHRAVGITRLLAHEETGNAWSFTRDKAVRAFCRTSGIPFVEFPQFGVIRGLRHRDDWARLHAAFLSEPIIPRPTRLIPAADVPPGPIPTAQELGLPPDGCERTQPGGRQSALALLDSFFGGRGALYRRAMSSPLSGAHACSRLSVPLATGAISIREVLHRAEVERSAFDELPPDIRPIPLAAIDSLVSRLHWHCHFIQKLEREPELEFRALHPAHELARHRTAEDDPLLEAWATGHTGFPFLDACMRSLIATGWLNFRMRAMVQAFGTYQLGLDWHTSGTRLARLFTDYEPGIHWPQVQMQAGATGINTPRIYNPVKQGIDQDPDGRFTRFWLPEIAATSPAAISQAARPRAGIPLAHLQTPWTLDADSQRAVGCLIGKDYPAPIVDLGRATRQARDRLTEIRRQPGYREAAQSVFDRHGSRKRRLDEDDPPKQQATQAKRRTEAIRQLGLDL